MNKNFNQAIQDLESGLISLDNIIKNPNIQRFKTDKAIIQRDLQIERIAFFRKGYNFCKKELKEQSKLT